jgi:hypothetical protein
MCDQGKVEYANRNQAHIAAQKSGARNINVYRHDDHYHFTRAGVLAPRKYNAPQSTTGPKSFTPSAKTLRGRLENASREIAALDKRLAKAEQKRADENLRIAHLLKQSELETELEMQAISELVSRLRR